jgi:hypothetical protein
MKLVASFVATASIAMLLAGCGGGGDSSTTITTSSLSKAQFVKRAEEICTKGTTPILGEIVKYEEKAAAGKNGGGSDASAAAAKTVVPPAIQKQNDGIRALGAPAGDEAQIEAFLVALQKDSDEIKNGPPLKNLEELDVKFKRSGGLATKYGLSACSYG